MTSSRCNDPTTRAAEIISQYFHFIEISMEWPIVDALEIIRRLEAAGLKIVEK